jgi:hypothetical protein
MTIIFQKESFVSMSLFSKTLFLKRCSYNFFIEISPSLLKNRKKKERKTPDRIYNVLKNI